MCCKTQPANQPIKPILEACILKLGSLQALVIL